MSPRRSSRARTTQPPPSVATHSNSSSSVSSARTDRASRVNAKQTSPPKSSTPHSLSSEEPEEPPHGAQPEPPLTRRRTREHDNDEDESAKLDDELDEDIAEEDEITRCVCGYQEYPGPPSDAGKPGSALVDPDTQTDELGGLFIQCDVCKVWQHGGCVGIMDEAASPDEYFCEECRKDLHKVTTSPKGQKYSRYLPVYDQQQGKNRKSSISRESDGHSSKDKDRNNRASVDSFGKRRSTMNSRAAYDEDEVLRKVIEESKHQGAPASENGNRKKRSRDDSEETKPEIKRQRTGSRSPSGSPVIESEDDSTKASAPKQKPRGAAAKSQREKEQREKERESHRNEAASRRKGRAERRKGDDPEEAEPTPAATIEEPPMAPLATETTVPEPPTADLKPAPAPRRGGRPPQKARGRLGRNQYSRDTVPATNGTLPKNDAAQSPQATTTNGATNGHHDSSDGTAGYKPAKKNWRLQKLSWNDIRRPAGAMQSYIAQRQVEMASGVKHTTLALAVQPATTMANGDSNQEQSKEDDTDLASFKNLSTTQMMDSLSRDLVHWQKLISEPTEKSPK
ncbi:PHD-finger motif containing protein [Pyrenophora tritici-repentis]|nr:PHD-finger motif containing protein [Pyrenophora tritici-repentis]KAI1572901.1 PHD-finger motif containing protein [Pyrenophora tritici-repentis]KAI1603172.1 PHD-finger motif containing protein [Pyrenophora tritici-repentis]PZD40438.1 PHD-finger motif containing protein [Pyrenophora tritici-repentis]